MTQSLSPSWFVVGDVHLHRDLDPRIARDLTDLIDGISEEDPDAWIIFNGDTFDLDRVRGEKDGGIGAHRAAARLDTLLSLHPDLVQSLRSHREGGGKLVFVAGNHDAELLLSPVRSILENHLANGESLEVVESFRWGDRVVEHGHRVDPEAAFFPDSRTALEKNRLSALPLASLMTRVLLSHIPKFELAGDNHEPPLKVLVRVLRDYKMDALKMIVCFPFAGIRVVWHALLARIRGDTCIDCQASMRSPWHATRRLYLDRYFGTVFAITFIVGLSVGWLPLWALWPAGLMVFALAIPPSRRKRFAHRDVEACERLAAQHVEKGARLVILGHTHRAFVERLESGAIYANHGAFFAILEDPPHRTLIHVDASGICSLKTNHPKS